jgi:hypothetical protein
MVHDWGGRRVGEDAQTGLSILPCSGSRGDRCKDSLMVIPAPFCKGVEQVESMQF